MLSVFLFKKPARLARTWLSQYLILVLWLAGLLSSVTAQTVVTSEEDGRKQTGATAIWHNADGLAELNDALLAFENGEFYPLQSAGSTGLLPGAIWTRFDLVNESTEPVKIYLEYVDHQLTEINAWARDSANGAAFEHLLQLTMESPFDSRPVPFPRFVIPVTIPANTSKELLVKFGSQQGGYVYPSMRIWDLLHLQEQAALQTGLVGFVFGAVFIMGVATSIIAVAVKNSVFLVYSAYALAKIIAWGTIVGITQQFILREQFHWNYMSATAAVSLLLGVLYARLFLESARYLPKLDKVFLVMMGNTALLFLAAVFQVKIVALVTITLALLLIPWIAIAGLIRWRQGSVEAGVFAFAWAILVTALFAQALRDLGIVAHTLFSYYAPLVTSGLEAFTLLVAIGLRLRRLRLAKQQADRQVNQALESARQELEQKVAQRTQELNDAREKAEAEARTDDLTGIRNRRWFLSQSQELIELADRKQQGLSMMIMDIDHFKRINDQYGHQVGDEALRLFAQTLNEHIRSVDVFGRLGGEEFGLVVMDEGTGAKALAEKLCHAIQSVMLPSLPESISLTASFGVAERRTGETIQRLMQRADEAMYAAKESGRNRVFVAV